MNVGGIGNCWYTVYVAVRFLENEDYDEGQDPRAVAAHEAGLETYAVRPRATWLDDDVDESKLIVLIGTRLALIGDGGPDAERVPADALCRAIDETRKKLKQAGIDQVPALWTHCDIDLGD